jgi:hypothetical protein
MKVNGQLHAPAALLPGNNPRTNWIGDWVGFRAGPDAGGIEPCRPARSLVTILTYTKRKSSQFILNTQ